MQVSSQAVCILALDIGSKRIGVARALLAVPIARPLLTLDRPETFVDDIVRLVAAEQAGAVVVGLPRGLEGQDTEQTRLVRSFADELSGSLTVPLHFIDEALTSAQAERELTSRAKPYAKGDVDALAATYILEDFLRQYGIGLGVSPGADYV